MTACCASVRASECHCAACHRTFGNLTLFDAHQAVDYTRRPAVACRAVGVLGLVQDARGTWHTPEGLKARESSATRLGIGKRERAEAQDAA